MLRLLRRSLLIEKVHLCFTLTQNYIPTQYNGWILHNYISNMQYQYQNTDQFVTLNPMKCPQQATTN